MGLGESVAAEAAFLAGPGCRTRPVMDVTSYISFPGFPQQLDHQENFLKVVDPVAEDTPLWTCWGAGKAWLQESALGHCSVGPHFHTVGGGDWCCISIRVAKEP